MSIITNITENIIWLNRKYKELNKQEKDDNNRVQLGRSFKMVDVFQFEFAKCISDFLKADKIIVDYPTSCTNRTQPIYPDIQIISKNEIKGIIEVKIDLGFLRLNEFGITYDKPNKKYSFGQINNSFAKTYSNFLTSEEVWYKKKKKGSNDKVDLRFDKQLKKIFIVVSRKNHPDRGPFFEQAMKQAGFKLLFLLDKIHPNMNVNIDSNIKEEIERKKEEIQKLFTGL